MNQVVRVVLPDGIHELTDHTRQLLRFMDRAGVIVLHRDDADGVCFDLLPRDHIQDTTAWAVSVCRDDQGFNAVAAPACPRE